MKKHLFMFLILCLICIFATGCSNKEPSENNSRTSASGTEDVDVDLTALSSTMVFAEVENMTVNPDGYLGKTVKMRGSYYASHSAETDTYYHFVLIEDTAACCQQGLEFIWNGDHTYPDDYPEDQAKIEATGVFKSYEVLGYTHYYLDVDDLFILE